MKKDCGSSLFFLPANRVLPYLCSVLSASVKSTLPSQLHRVVLPLFPPSSTLSSPRRFPRASLALYRNSREPFLLTDRNKNATHRSASLQRPDLLLLYLSSCFFFSPSLSFSLFLLLFTREGIGARAACHPFYAGDELTSQRAGYDGRIDCFIADYVSYAFCPVILPKWSPGIAILGDIPCVQLRAAERTRVPRVAHDRMEIEQR